MVNRSDSHSDFNREAIEQNLGHAVAVQLPFEPRKASGPARCHAAGRSPCLTGDVARERRLIFGEIAELYDRSRPSYPAALVEDLVQLARLDGDRSVLEIGAGGVGP